MSAERAPLHDAVLRLSCPGIDLEPFLSRYPLFRPDAVFEREGLSSAFNFSLAETSAAELDAAVYDALHRQAPMLAELAALGARGEVDVSLDVADAPMGSLRFQPRLLSLLATLNLSLTVSGYAISPD